MVARETRAQLFWMARETAPVETSVRHILADGRDSPPSAVPCCRAARNAKRHSHSSQRGRAARSARQPHKLQVAGSNPARAITRLAVPKPGPGKALCGAKTKTGTCGLVAGHGTNHLGVGRCKRHGGSTRNHVRAAEAELAVSAVQRFGLAREIDPHDALVEELARTAGHVDFLERLVGAGELSAEENATGRKRVVKLDQSTLNGDVPSVWVTLLQTERKHLVDVARACVSAGVEQRRVELAERQAAMIVEILRGVLTELGVIDRPEVPGIVRRHLSLAAGSPA